MGNDCFASTPNQFYNSFLTLNVGQLKDLWETVKLYKIKNIYQTHSTQYLQTDKTHIPPQSFVQIFPEFERYQQIHKKRLFQIFDYQNQGYLDWNNFFTTISICYFGSEEVLSVFMFMTFDESLAKELTKEQVQLMLELNAFAIKKPHQDLYFQIDQILDSVMKDSATLTINRWIELSRTYFDFSKYRRLFNIFKEEKIEKELIRQFHDWNDLYDQQTDRYISYVVCYKWFQTWKIYVQQNYGVTISQNSFRQLFKRSERSIRTTSKKSVKTNKKIGFSKTLKYIQGQEQTLKNQILSESQNQKLCSKNIDFVHNNIGQRPKQIYNSALEGEYKQVLKPQLVQNSDFVLVSEKVWNCLKQIYGGGPQFRRTGFDSVQLYPKIIKIYSALFKNQIDFSSEVIREVSGYLTVEMLLTRSIDLSQQDMKRKKVYYKTIGMIKWQEINDFSHIFSELTSDIIVYMIYLEEDQQQTFKKIHTKIAKDIGQINAGDYVKYTDSKTKIQKQAIFMGKNIQGKYILHFPKESYSLDECIVESDVIKYCKIYSPQSIMNEVKLKNKGEHDAKGISNAKGLGFINSMILNLFNNKNLKNLVSMMKTDHQDSKMIYYLIEIYQAISSKKKVDTRQINDMLKFFLPRYENFEISMSESFLNDFYAHLMMELTDLEMNDKFEQSVKIKFKSAKKCLKCLTEQKDIIQEYCVSVPLAIENQLVYQIVFVPICVGLRSAQIRKVGIVLPSRATLKQLKEEFQRVCQLDKKRLYILAEVFSNRIIKNYNSVQLDTPLQKLKLRSGDSLYAFELYFDFSKFISKHYSSNKNVTSKDVKVDNFIDCKHSQKGWIFGKVCQILYLPYTQETLVKVLHKFSKDQQSGVKSYFLDESISKYPTRCYLNSQQYHLQAVQRYFNEAVNQMQICNMPLVIVLTSWMRWKQFSFLVYLQLKRFISSGYGLQDLNEEDEQQLQDLRLISAKQIKTSKKIMNTHKISKFKEYLNGANFPYKIHLADCSGRCAICFKFLKSQIFKGESEIYCQGCNLSQSEPISWQIKVADMMVLIDWKNLNDFKRQEVIKQHSSLINLRTNKKVQVQSLVNCINNRFDPYVQEEELLCCNRPQLVSTQECLQNSPETIPIFLSRIIAQQNDYKKINTHPISFPMKKLAIGKSQYNLVGVTAIQGNNKNIKYKSYILKQSSHSLGLSNISQQKNGASLKNNQLGKNYDEWIQYEGEHTRIVSPSLVQKACALVLFYKKQGK